MQVQQLVSVPKMKVARAKRQKYHRISLKTKLIFYHKVIHEQANLIDITQRLGIKYSTAKTLLRNYKGLPEESDTRLVRSLLQEFDGKELPQKRCSYQSVEELTQMGCCSPRVDSDRNETEPYVPKVIIISSFLGNDSK